MITCAQSGLAFLLLIFCICIYFSFTIMSSDSKGYTFITQSTFSNSPTKTKWCFWLTSQWEMLQIMQEPTQVTLCIIIL